MDYEFIDFWKELKFASKASKINIITFSYFPILTGYFKYFKWTG